MIVGVSRNAVAAWGRKYRWLAQRECRRRGETWNGHSTGNGQPHNTTQVVEGSDLAEAVKLKGKHSREYRVRLDKLLERIEHVEELLLSQVDPASVELLSRSYDRLVERYRIVQGISLPATVKSSPVEPKKVLPPSIPVD